MVPFDGKERCYLVLLYVGNTHNRTNFHLLDSPSKARWICEPHAASWDMLCRAGDVVCVTWASENNEFWGGFVLGQEPSINSFIVRKDHLLCIPTRVERPDLEFIDDFTPVLCRGMLVKECFISLLLLTTPPLLVVLATDSMHPEDNINWLSYDAGDVLSVVGVGFNGKLALACHGRLAKVSFVYDWCLFRMPTRQERPDLEYIDNDVPILWYGEYRSYNPVNQLLVSCLGMTNLVLNSLLIFSASTRGSSRYICGGPPVPCRRYHSGTCKEARFDG